MQVTAGLGVSRQCAHRGWADTGGMAGLAERRSGPRASVSKTLSETEQKVLAARRELRAGPDHIVAATGCGPAPSPGILRRYGIPVLAACDPLTGQQIRASRASERRYEHGAPGDIVHIDVKKLGQIPDGGGRRIHGHSEPVRGRGIGRDHVHTAIDDHIRLA